MDDLHWYVSKFLEKRQFRQFYRDVSPMRNHLSPSAVASSGSSGLSKCEIPSEKMEKCLQVCRADKLRTAHGHPHADCHGNNVDQVLVLPKMKCCSLRNVAVDSNCCYQMLAQDKTTMRSSSDFSSSCSCENTTDRTTSVRTSPSKCCWSSPHKATGLTVPTFVSSKAAPLPYSCSCPEINPRSQVPRSGDTGSFPSQDLLYVDITCGCIPKSYTCQNMVSKNGLLRDDDLCDANGSAGRLLGASHTRRHSNDNCLSPKRCACPIHFRERCGQSSEISPLHTYCIYQNLISNGQFPKSGRLSQHAQQQMLCSYPEAVCKQHPKRVGGRKVSPLCRSCTFHEIPTRDAMSSSSLTSISETLDKAITTAGNVKQFLRECARDRYKLSNECGPRKLSDPNVRRYGLGMVHNASCPSKLNASVDSTHIDDEHRLIARYAARLAADSHNAARSPTELNFCLDSNKAQRELIAQLEAKNREIMKEIQRLRVEQEAHAKRSSAAEYNPTLLAELRLLRQRKDELESRMQALQESRRELMLQLESLMKLLKNHGSPRSTPNSSPRSRSGQSPTTGVLPGGGRGSTPSTPMDSLSGLGGDVRQAFHQMPSSAANARNLRNDLLVAADSVTNAMSSLVKELNSEASGSDGEGDITKTANGGLGSGELFHTQESDDVSGWREEMKLRLAQEQQFIAELRARRDRSAHSSRNTSDNEQEPYDGDIYVRTDDDRLTNDDCDSYVRTDDESVIRTDEEDAELYDNHPKELAGRYTTDDESYRTDEESVIRTDDEEGGNTDWEESMKRWINR